MKFETISRDIENNTFDKNIKKLESLKINFRKLFFIFLALSASFGASLQEVKAQVEVPNKKPNPEMENEFLKQKDFLINWYQNRVIEKNKFNRKFQGEKPKILQRLETVTLSSTAGDSEWRNDTIFINPIDFETPGNKNVITHELGHDAFPANYGEKNVEFKTNMPDWMREMILKAIKISGDKGLETVSLFKKYYQRPEEVYSRICALRQKCNLSPDQAITEAVLDKIINQNGDDENIKTLIMTISDKEELLFLINNLP